LLADTHCHLDFENFNQDRESVIDRARQEGLFWILNPGINVSNSRGVVKLADAYPEIYAAVGVHPNDAMHWEESMIDELSELSRHKKVVAIGEIGLDYYRDRTPRDLQRRILRQQLELAAETSLPVIIHLRNRSLEEQSATLDLLTILVEWCSDLLSSNSILVDFPGVLHSFSGNLISANQVLDLNFYIGISGPVTFRKAESTREVAAIIPIEKLLVETDAPFLTPHPHRSKRNEPALVNLVADEISSLRQLPREKIAEVTSENARQLFRW